MREKDTITLGSGKLYAVLLADETIPENAEIEKAENLLGLIKGGAELEYTPETYTAKDDLGLAVKEVLTSEEVKMKSGIMTWNGDTIKKLTQTGRVTEAGGIRTVKIGGTANQTGAKYVLLFVHTDKQDGDVRIKIVGRNTAGFTLAFKPDEETIIDAEFTALPDLDDEGTLVILEEQIEKPAGRMMNGEAAHAADEADTKAKK